MMYRPKAASAMNFNFISFKRKPREFSYPGYYRDYIRLSNQFHIMAGLLLFAVMWVAGNAFEKMRILSLGESKLAMYAIVAYFLTKLCLNAMLIGRFIWVAYLKMLMSAGILVIAINLMLFNREFLFSSIMLVTSVYSLVVNFRFSRSDLRWQQ